jgi:hypothetical protein
LRGQKPCAGAVVTSLRTTTASAHSDDARLDGGVQRVNMSDTESYAAHREPPSAIQFDLLDEIVARVLHYLSVAANRWSLIGLLGRVHTCLH